MANMKHVLFVLILTATGITSNEELPRITNYNKDEIIINAGTRLELTCEGRKNVTWTHPFMGENTETVSITYERKRDYTYVAYLKMEDANTEYTGYFNCTTQDSGSMDNIYVYIKDPSKPFVSESYLSFISVVQYREAILPCRTTSPDIKVVLKRSNEDVPIGYNSEDGSNMSFDPKIGFTLDYANNKHADEYTCLAGDHQMKIHLNILPHTTSVAKPKIASENMSHAIVNSNMTLTCTVAVDIGVRFSMYWELEHKSAFKEKRYLQSPTTMGTILINGVIQQLGTLTLTIFNIKYEDEGIYKCTVTDHASNSNENTIAIKVYDKNVSYINLTVFENMYNITQNIGESVKWVVDVLAYPKPELIWYNTKHNPITKDMVTKYIVKTDENAKQTTLEILNVNMNDRGMYVLQATNSGKIKNANFTLIIKGKPELEFKDVHSYYSIGKKYNIICDAVGSPIPKVTWQFKPCTLLRNCSADVDLKPIPESQYQTIKIDDIKVTSTLSITPNISGFLFCSAENSEYLTNDTIGLLVTDIPEGTFNAWNPAITRENVETVVGDNVTLYCGATWENYTGGLTWMKKVHGIDSPTVINSYEYQIMNFETSLSYQSVLKLPNIQLGDGGKYMCQTKEIDDDTEEQREIEVDIKRPVKPKIGETNLNTTDLYKSSDEGLILICKCEKGKPKPIITWYKDNKPLNPRKNDTRISLKNNNETLVITFIKEENEGIYKCEARNRNGSDFRVINVKLKDKPGQGVGMVIAIIIVGLILLVLIIVLSIKIKKERELRKAMTVAGLMNFDEGALESLNPELSVDDQAELLPYDKKWEFPRDKLKLGKQLGAGAFGVVMKAEAFGIVEGESVSIVAVKMVKRNADFTYIKALASELKIMVHLGKHLNVVNLLGACTSNIIKRELLVIVEYCRFGNLHNYLLRHRENFIDQVDPKTGAIDPTIGADILSRADSFSCKNRVKYAALSFPNSGDSHSNHSGGDITVDYRCASSVCQQSTDSSGMEVNISMAPTGEDSSLMSNNSIQPEWRSNYRGDYKGTVRPICTRDLVCWAFQVARGMEYLAGRKVLHGDLAARNILLSDYNIVKICDFGLAKSMYKSENYKKKGDGPLPVKWMAIESIRDRVFSIQSDIWSFGIVLWEFFSLARTPYPGMEADEKLYNKLLDGYRMEKPPYATMEMYNTMRDCWQVRPNQRPTFTQLAEQMGSFLEESVRRHYIELNDPYIDMNEQWLQGVRSDYLSMMNAPTYSNLVSPSYDCDSRYVNSSLPPCATSSEQGEGSGYLCMKSPASTSSEIFSPRVATVGATVFDFSTPQQKRLQLREPDDTNANGSELHPILRERPSGSECDTENINDLNKGLGLGEKDMDNYTTPNSSQTGLPSFENRSYHSVPMINPSKDNYINMPQHKKAQVNPDCNDKNNTKAPSGFSNPSYVTMGLTMDKTPPPNGAVQNLYINPQYPISSGGNESYVNLPR